MRGQDSPDPIRRGMGSYFRWAARGAGTLIALFVLFMLLGHLFFDEEVEDVEDTSPLIGVGVGLIASWVAASLLSGWKWERQGGYSTVAAGIALGVFVFFTAGSNELIVSVSMGIPVAMIGVLYVLASRAEVG